MGVIRRIAELAIAGTIAAIGAQIALSVLPITDAPQFLLEQWGEPFFMINLYKAYGWFLIFFAGLNLSVSLSQQLDSKRRQQLRIEIYELEKKRDKLRDELSDYEM